MLVELLQDNCLNSRREETENGGTAFVQDVFDHLENDFRELFASDSVHDVHMLLLVDILWIDLVVSLRLLLPFHEIQLLLDEVNLQDHQLSLLLECVSSIRQRSAVVEWQSVENIPQLIELNAILHECENLSNPVSIQWHLIRPQILSHCIVFCDPLRQNLERAVEKLIACRRWVRSWHAFQQMVHLLHHLLKAVSLRLNGADEEELQRVEELQVDLSIDPLLYLEVSWECLEQFLACITTSEGVEQQRKVVHIIPKALQQKLEANREVLLDECLLFVVVLAFLLEHGVELKVARI